MASAALLMQRRNPSGQDIIRGVPPIVLRTLIQPLGLPVKKHQAALEMLLGAGRRAWGGTIRSELS